MAKRIPKAMWKKAGRAVSRRRGVKDKDAYQVVVARKMIGGKKRTTSK